MTEPIDGEPCRFRTATRRTLWPIRVDRARLQGPPFAAPPQSLRGRRGRRAAGSLECLCAATPRSPSCRSDRLRFFLQRAAAVRLRPVRAAVSTTRWACMSARVADGSRRRCCPPNCLQPVGFAGRGLARIPARRFPGYRLLTEFFVVPGEVPVLRCRRGWASDRGRLGRKLHLYFFLRRLSRDLETQRQRRYVPAGLHADRQPVSQRAEPIRLTQTRDRVPRRARRAASAGARGLLGRPRDGDVRERRTRRVLADVRAASRRNGSRRPCVLARRAARRRDIIMAGSTRRPKCSCRSSI